MRSRNKWQLFNVTFLLIERGGVSIFSFPLKFPYFPSFCHFPLNPYLFQTNSLSPSLSFFLSLSLFLYLSHTLSLPFSLSLFRIYQSAIDRDFNKFNHCAYLINKIRFNLSSSSSLPQFQFHVSKSIKNVINFFLDSFQFSNHLNIN